MGFLQKLWHVMKDDILKVFKELYNVESFVKSLNVNFLVLIAKVEGAINIKDSNLLVLSEASTNL